MSLTLKILLIALFGALGTLCRWGLGNAVHSVSGPGFPYGILAANLLGCLAFGLFTEIAETKLGLNSHLRAAVLIGFMGAFTTFSTYAFNTVDMVHQGRLLHAFANLATNNVLGLAAVFGGLYLGRAI